jgi:hypothetical protein
MFWGSRTKKKFAQQGPLMEVKFTDAVYLFYRFLHARRNAYSQPLSRMFGVPQVFADQWIRLSWLPFTCAPDHVVMTQSSWTRAWHGTKIEAIYATAYHGILLESSDEELVERYLANGQGVYLHGDANRHKVGCYSRFTQLVKGGAFYAVHWEVRTDRESRVKGTRRTDQWVQPSQSVQLAALWVCMRDVSQMVDASPVSLPWDPELEASPFATAILNKVRRIEEFVMSKGPVCSAGLHGKEKE